MTQTLYERAQRSDRRCMDCGKFPDTDYRHWRACVPKRYWPEWVRLGFATRMQWEIATAPTAELTAARAAYQDGDLEQIIETAEAYFDAVLPVRSTIIEEIRADGFACSECDTVAKSAAGLAAHRRKHAREVINAG